MHCSSLYGFELLCLLLDVQYFKNEIHVEDNIVCCMNMHVSLIRRQINHISAYHVDLQRN